MSESDMGLIRSGNRYENLLNNLWSMHIPLCCGLQILAKGHSGDDNDDDNDEHE